MIRILSLLLVLFLGTAATSCSGGDPGPSSKNFELQLEATSGTVAAGSSISLLVYCYQQVQSSDLIMLSAGSVSTGTDLIVSFSPSQVTPNGSSVLTLQPKLTLLPGTYSVTVSGQKGSLLRSADYTLTVIPASGFSLGASTNTLNVAVSGSASATIQSSPISGFSGNVSLSASPAIPGLTYSFAPATIAASGSSALTIQAAGSASTGSHTVTITGTSGSIVRTTTLTLNIVCGFTLTPSFTSLTVAKGSSATVSIGATPTGACAGSGLVNIALTASPAIAGLSYSFSPGVIAAISSSSLTLQASTSATAGTYAVTVLGTNGTVSTSTTFSLTISSTASFSLVASPAATSISLGSSVAVGIQASATGGFSGSVTLSASPALAGISYSFSPSTISSSGTSTLTIQSTQQAAPGSQTITITGTSGSLQRTAVINLTVSSAAVRTFSASPSISIPDANTTGVTSSINSTLQATIRSVAVSVNITHAYRGDLELVLSGPGASIPLQVTSNDSGVNVVTTYPIVTAPSSALSVLVGTTTFGVWTLRVRDLVPALVGTLNSWKITFNGEMSNASTSTFSSSAAGVQSQSRTLTFAETGTVAFARVRVNMTHTYMGDLELLLTAPDGQTVFLHNQGGGSADYVPTVYPDLTVPVGSLNSLSGRPIQGTWTLRVRDLYGPLDGGTWSGWTLSLEAL